MWLPAPPRFRRWLGWQGEGPALRSASGQNSIGRDRILAFIEDTVCWGVDVTGGLSGGIIELEVLADDIAEGFARLCRLQAAIEIDRGLDIAMAEQAPHRLVLVG